MDDNCDGTIDDEDFDLDQDGIADCLDLDDDGDGFLDGIDCAPVDGAAAAVASRLACRRRGPGAEELAPRPPRGPPRLIAHALRRAERPAPWRAAPTTSSRLRATVGVVVGSFFEEPTGGVLQVGGPSGSCLLGVRERLRGLGGGIHPG